MHCVLFWLWLQVIWISLNCVCNWTETLVITLHPQDMQEGNCSPVGWDFYPWLQMDEVLPLLQCSLNLFSITVEVTRWGIFCFSLQKSLFPWYIHTVVGSPCPAAKLFFPSLAVRWGKRIEKAEVRKLRSWNKIFFRFHPSVIKLKDTKTPQNPNKTGTKTPKQNKPQTKHPTPFLPLPLVPLLLIAEQDIWWHRISLGSSGCPGCVPSCPPWIYLLEGQHGEQKRPQQCQRYSASAETWVCVCFVSPVWATNPKHSSRWARLGAAT